VWFGDGVEDFVAERDCIVFEVAGMAAANPPPAAVVGPVYPTCHWEIDESDQAGAARDDDDDDVAELARAAV